jgi:hypothetical protein
MLAFASGELALLLAGCASLRIAEDRAVTIEEVIRMSKAGVGKDVIVQQLDATYSKFRLTSDDIVRLTEEGVDQDVIRAMVKSGERPGPYGWEQGYWPSQDWVDRNDFIGLYGGYTFPYYMPYTYMRPYMVYREPGLVGSFYHYIPLGGKYRPYSEYFYRRDRERVSGQDDGENR